MYYENSMNKKQWSVDDTMTTGRFLLILLHYEVYKQYHAEVVFVKDEPLTETSDHTTL